MSAIVCVKMRSCVTKDADTLCGAVGRRGGGANVGFWVYNLGFLCF